jgi:hypothetical protein
MNTITSCFFRASATSNVGVGDESSGPGLQRVRTRVPVAARANSARSTASFTDASLINAALIIAAFIVAA